MGKKLGVAIIGTGMIANIAHIPAWQALKDQVEFVGMADALPERAKATAKSVGLTEDKGYGDPVKMLEECKPDIVSVCTPNCFHKQWTIEALKHGAHVLCEKPIAPGYADALEMYKVAEQVGKVLFVGQSSRFMPEAEAAKEIVSTGVLGDVYYAETSACRRRGVPKWGQFPIKEDNGGGPVYDIGVHSLDALLWILGNPQVTAVSGGVYTKIANTDEGLKEDLAASGAPEGVLTPRPYSYKEFTVEDYAAGFMRLEGGMTLFLKSSWAANIPSDGFGGTYALGTKCGLKLHPLTLLGVTGAYTSDTLINLPTPARVPFVGHRGETAHLLKVIAGEEEMRVKKCEVLNVIGALEMMYRSSDIGREVTLCEITGNCK